MGVQRRGQAATAGLGIKALCKARNGLQTPGESQFVEPGKALYQRSPSNPTKFLRYGRVRSEKEVESL
jgi:hypothetical protein